MAVFSYRALSRAGEEVSGVLAGSNEWELKKELRSRGLFVAELRQMRRWRAFGLSALLGRSAGRSDRKVIEMTRHLVQFRRAGIPLEECFGIMARDERDGRWRRLLLDVAERLRSGGSLAASLAAQEGLFPDVYVKAVGAAEEAGRLEEALSDLAVALGARLSLRRRLADALLYPALVACVSVFVVAFLLGYVVPRVAAILEGSGELLPAPTRALLAISSCFRTHGLLIGIGAVLLVVAARIALAHAPLARLADRVKLKLPIIAGLQWKGELANFGSSLALLLKSGVPLVEAMGAAQGVVRNRCIREAIQRAQSAVDSGGPLATALGGVRGLPLSMLSVVAAGEESGELAGALSEVSAAFREDVELACQRLSKLVEPVAIILLGAFVAFVAFAVLLPILRLSEAML
jgi:general secretion pathway protein F